MSDLGRLEQRQFGAFPMSIATSLAFEGLFGKHPDRPQDTTNYSDGFELMLVNIRTLFRNMTGSLPKEVDYGSFISDTYAEAMLDEMSIIDTVLQEQTGGRLKVQFYVCSYQSLTGLYPESRFKEATTQKQTHYAALENSTVQVIQRILKERQEEQKLQVCDVTIQSPHVRTLLLTHFPVDLLNTKGQIDLGLLESHTGVVKRRARWNTKLRDGKNLVRMPFDKMTVQIFGDTGGLFSPYPKDYRDKLIELGEKYKWNSTSTRDRILQCIALDRNPTYEAVFRKLYR